ncbi:hypothetical protein pb186bvf_011486 [Paramecium bursaria]
MSSNGLMGNMLVEAVMEKAIRDKAKLQQEQQQRMERRQEVPEEECDEEQDEDLKEMLREMKKARLREIQAQQVKEEKKVKGIGEYREIVEEEFLPSVTKNQLAIVHFYHNDFERCKVMDNHLRVISQKHPECKFFYLNAEKSPFFVQKLAIQVLPTLCLFKQGIMKDRIVGFEKLGGRDQFDTLLLVRLLQKYEMIKTKKINQSESEDDDEN